MQEDLTKEILDALWQAKKALEYLPTLPAGFKPSHLRVLEAVWIAENAGTSIRISEISAHMKITRPNVTTLVQELCTLSALEKYPSQKDGRVTLLRLTSFGRACVEKYILGYHAKLAEEFSQLDPGSCQQMISSIQKISAIMQKKSKLYRNAGTLDE